MLWHARPAPERGVEREPEGEDGDERRQSQCGRAEGNLPRRRRLEDSLRAQEEQGRARHQRLAQRGERRVREQVGDADHGRMLRSLSCSSR